MTRPHRQGEGALSDAIREALAHEPGLLLFRNSVGVLRSRGRVYHTGLGNGSADLVGVLAGRFVALEVKRPGEAPTPEDVARIEAKLGAIARRLAGTPMWLRAVKALPDDERRVLEQEAFAEAVRKAGGFACYVDGVEAARAAIARARTGAAS